MKRYLYLMMVMFVALLAAEVAHSRGFGGGGFGGGGFRAGGYGAVGFRAGGYDADRYRSGGYDADRYRPAYQPRRIDVYDPNYVVQPTDDGYGYSDNGDDSNGD